MGGLSWTNSKPPPPTWTIKNVSQLSGSGNKDAVLTPKAADFLIAFANSLTQMGSGQPAIAIRF